MRRAFVRAIPKRSPKEQEEYLLAFGITKRELYVDGASAESLSSCIASFRGQGGELFIAADLRVFGESRKAILDTMAMLDSLKIKVCDIHSGENSMPMMIDRALAELASYSRWAGSRGMATRTGRKGGKTKAIKQEAKRAEIAHPDVVRRLCECDKISWREKSAILGGNPYSTATLRRRYGK